MPFIGEARELSSSRVGSAGKRGRRGGGGWALQASRVGGPRRSEPGGPALSERGRGHDKRRLTWILPREVGGC